LVVFHFRYAGAKGVLARYPDRLIQLCLKDQYDPQAMIYLRKSQVKFYSPLEDLEIVSCSKPTSDASLNRFFILILLALQVPLEVSKRRN
jgi:hypothetical protein